MDIVAAIRAGDLDHAVTLDARLRPLWDLFSELSSLRVVHAAARLLGVSSSEPPRPILPLNQAADRRIAAVLQKLGLS